MVSSYMHVFYYGIMILNDNCIKIVFIGEMTNVLHLNFL